MTQTATLRIACLRGGYSKYHLVTPSSDTSRFARGGGVSKCGRTPSVDGWDYIGQDELDEAVRRFGRREICCTQCFR